MRRFKIYGEDMAIGKKVRRDRSFSVRICHFFIGRKHRTISNARSLVIYVQSLTLKILDKLREPVASRPLKIASGRVAKLTALTSWRRMFVIIL